MPSRVTIDFETMPIVSGSPSSPEPVGVAIRKGGRSRYHAWGHPIENNTTKEKVKTVLKDLCKNNILLMHNAQFDLRVLEDHFGLMPDRGFDDTKILAFLKHPSNKTLSLKPLSEQFFKIKPEERDRMHDWLGENYPPARLVGDKTKYTAFAPGSLAGEYAVGDVDRTMDLFKLFDRQLDSEERAAYEREKSVVVPTIKMERAGVRIDVDRLEVDLELAQRRRNILGYGLSGRLRDPMINLNSRPQMAKALFDAGLVKVFLKTEKENESVSIPSLRMTCTDQDFVDDLELYSKLGKLIGTYMTPWLFSAHQNNGYFYPYFNPTRVDSESGVGGTRTGRYSSNFQQVPKEAFKGLPFMRNYVLPDKGYKLVDRDYSQQELRILAHFAGGALTKAYQANPQLDMHTHVQAIIRKSIPDIDRKAVKTCNFLTIYGGGVNRLADQLGITHEEARRIREEHQKALPEVAALNTRLRREHKADGFIRTWGGRKYTLDFQDWYKLINVLIQGSAADQTKEAIRRYDVREFVDARLMLQVHDELVISSFETEKGLRWAMEEMSEWDVPMLTDKTTGKSWGEAK